MNPELPHFVESFLHALRQRCIRQDDAESVRQFGDAYRQLTAFARDANHDERDQILHLLTEAMAAIESNWEFGGIANTCGMIVEWGGTPSIAVDAVLDRITTQIERIPDFLEVMQTHLGVEHPNRIADDDWRALGIAHPDHAWVIGEWYALQFMGCAAMTMLCRDVEARKRARGRIDLIQRAEASRSDNPYAYYLAETLGMIDDERLLILDTTRCLGFRVHLTAVRNNFHLFTLLQDALLAHATADAWQGPRVQPIVTALAKGERMLADISPNEWSADQVAEQDAALWSYYTNLAMRPDGTLQTMREAQPNLPHWVWGEGKPTDIPEFKGERVVLLGPLEVPRAWSLGFFAPLHPALRSAVRIESTLSEAECSAWLTRLRAGQLPTSD